MWCTLCSKTLLIDHVAIGGKGTVSWNAIWFSVLWLGPTGCLKNGVLLVSSGKQGETGEEGRLRQSQPSVCHVRFHGNTISWACFDVKTDPHKVKSCIWNISCSSEICGLYDSPLPPFSSPLQNLGTKGKRAEPHQDCAVCRQLCKTVLLSNPTFAFSNYLQFQLIRSSWIMSISVMIQHWK